MGLLYIRKHQLAIVNYARYHHSSPSDLVKFNVEVTGVARLYRAASVCGLLGWTKPLRGTTPPLCPTM